MHRVHDSSLVKSVGFSGGSTGTLRIRFDDAVLDFGGVSHRIYQGLLDADDPGGYYQRYIHSKYPYIKL